MEGSSLFSDWTLPWFGLCTDTRKLSQWQHQIGVSDLFSWVYLPWVWWCWEAGPPPSISLQQLPDFANLFPNPLCCEIWGNIATKPVWLHMGKIQIFPALVIAVAIFSCNSKGGVFNSQLNIIIYQYVYQVLWIPSFPQKVSFQVSFKSINEKSFSL